jgi:hypothetical protein
VKELEITPTFGLLTTISSNGCLRSNHNEHQELDGFWHNTPEKLHVDGYHSSEGSSLRTYAESGLVSPSTKRRV